MIYCADKFEYLAGFAFGLVFDLITEEEGILRY